MQREVSRNLCEFCKPHDEGSNNNSSATGYRQGLSDGITNNFA